jgi:hypothetical protein
VAVVAVVVAVRLAVAVALARALPKLPHQMTGSLRSIVASAPLISFIGSNSLFFFW